MCERIGSNSQAERQMQVLQGARSLAEKVSCPDLETLPLTPIAGICVDMGTSNIKAICVGENGEIIGRWSIPIADAFLAGGYVNLDTYATNSLAVLSAIGQSSLNFESLKFVMTDGIYPSTVIQDSGDQFLDRFGFTYAASKLGTRTANQYQRVGLQSQIHRSRGVYPAPQIAAEAVRDLLKAGVITKPEKFLVEGLTDYVISYLLGGNQQSAPFNANQYMGLVKHDKTIFSPGITSANNLLPTNDPNQLKVGLVNPGILRELGFKTGDREISLYNRGVDGMAIQGIMDLAKERGIGQVIARAKTETTVAGHIATTQLTDKPFGGWILRDGDGWKVGMASNDGAAKYRELTWDQGYQLLPLGNSMDTYRSFFERRDNESDVQYYTRLDNEAYEWIKDNRQLFLKMIDSSGVWLFGPDRNGNGPKKAKFSKEKFPEDPRAFWYLLKESSALSMRRIFSEIEDYSGKPIDTAIVLGPMVNSDFWKYILAAVTKKRSFVITYNGRVEREPSLISLALTALEQHGDIDAAQKLKEGIDFIPISADQDSLFSDIDADRRFEEYRREFQ